MEITTAVVFAALAAWLTLSIPNSVQAQAPAGAKDKGGGRGFAQDPRAQTRIYHFEDTNEDLPYSLYVSSRVKKGQKARLVVTLNGLSAPQTTLDESTKSSLLGPFYRQDSPTFGPLPSIHFDFTARRRATFGGDWAVGTCRRRSIPDLEEGRGGSLEL